MILRGIFRRAMLGWAHMFRAGGWFRPRVFVFHRIGEPSASAGWGSCLATSSFEAFLDFLLEEQVDAVTLGEMAEPSRSQRYRVGISFDDGHYDTYAVAWPLLRARGMSATTFITTSFLGASAPPHPWESSGMAAKGMTTEQLTEVAAHGMEIGSHGRHHPPFPRLSPAALDEECCESKRVLERIIEGPVHEFAYPHGLYDGRVVSAVKAAGYRHAWTCDPFPVHTGVRPYSLPRISVSESIRTREDFLRLLWGDDLRGRLNLRFGGRKRALNSIPCAGADTNVRPS